MAQVTCGSATHAIEPFSGEFDDLCKANTATTSIRDRSSLKIHIEIRLGILQHELEIRDWKRQLA